MKWTPMTEHKPPKNGQYLVTYTHNCFGKRYVGVDKDDWDDLGEFFEEYKDKVTAWAELPAPYMEGANN